MLGPAPLGWQVGAAGPSLARRRWLRGATLRGGGLCIASLECWPWPWDGLREVEFAGSHLAATLMQVGVRSVRITDWAKEAEEGERDVLLLGVGEEDAET